MKSYHVNKGAGIAGLMVKEHDIPVPGPHEVLVRVRANSLNFRELSILRGYYPLPIRPDVVPVSDGAGWVVAVGSDVTRAQFLAMNRAITLNKLKPVIDRVFPFDDARAAYHYYEDGQHFGKVIISHY